MREPHGLNASGNYCGWLIWHGENYPLSRIANSLVEAIASAKYPVGSNLPTEHELSAKLKVSRATIVAALDELERLGLVYRRPRLGTQVASRFPVMNHVRREASCTTGRATGSSISSKC